MKLSSQRRNIHRLLGRLSVYLLLVVGAIIFLWPFAWMAATSIKVEREIFSPKLHLLPEPPVPAKVSPYVDTSFFKDVSGPRLDEALQAISNTLANNPGFIWPSDVNPETAAPQVARGIYNRLQTLLPSTVWKAAPAELRDSIEAQINQHLLDQVIAQLRRHLAIGQLRIRYNDLHEEELTPSERIAESWQVKGPAKLIPVIDNARHFADLNYDFSKSENLVLLSNTYTTNFPVQQLQRLQLYLCPDNSWHRVTIVIEMLGKRFEAVSPHHLIDFTWTTLTWQHAGPDDHRNKIKSWTLLQEVPVDPGSAIESAPNKIKVTIELTKSSAAEAWIAKIARNYRATFAYIPFWRYIGTSLFLAILNIILALVSSSLVAYAFARLQWPGRRFSFGLMLATIMIPSQVTMIPQFLIVKWLGWYNTLYPLWVPSMFAAAFNVFLLRQFLKGIPRDLEDAAKIDGCGYWRIYWHVMLPLVRPTLGAIAIFTFIATWNDFMGPLVYLSDQRLYPLSLGLFALDVQTTGATGSIGIMMAGSLLMTLPVILIFLAALKLLPADMYLPRHEKLRDRA